MVAEALPHIAHPQMRNRGTMGGNLSHADTASEVPAIVVALGGRLHARLEQGERWIAASDFLARLFGMGSAMDGRQISGSSASDDRGRVRPDRCGDDGCCA